MPGGGTCSLGPGEPRSRRTVFNNRLGVKISTASKTMRGVPNRLPLVRRGVVGRTDVRFEGVISSSSSELSSSGGGGVIGLGTGTGTLREGS